MTNTPSSALDNPAWKFLFAAWIIALAATLGVLFIGEIMGQTPCNLCWHQRAFMFPLAVILAVASFRGDPDIWRYALPVAALGWLVAAFHSLLYVGVIPKPIEPCGQGPSCSSADMTIFGGLPLPFLSLAAFTGIAVLLILVHRRTSASTRRAIVIITVLVAAIAFAGSVVLYDRYGADHARALAPAAGNELVRPHSPIIGPADAPVTIVEFFDPSCETCRAFHPIVKRILTTFPKDVRLILRYTTFHEGSDEAVRILETARKQGKFEPVLEALLTRQPQWAVHGAPNLSKAWEFARVAGLDVERARGEASSSNIDLVLKQDAADVQANKVRQTPTFFVNGKPLASFGGQQLLDLVQSEVRRVKTGS